MGLDVGAILAQPVAVDHPTRKGPLMMRAFYAVMLSMMLPALAEAGAVPVPAPEPATAMLLAAGAAAAGIQRYRRRR